MRLAFHEDALEEYTHAARYYAGRNPELALRFIEAVEAAIGRWPSPAMSPLPKLPARYLFCAAVEYCSIGSWPLYTESIQRD